MNSYDADRRQMAEAFIAAHGTEVANIIMDHLPPTGWSDLATRRDLSETALVLRSELKAEIANLRDELKSEISGLRDEMHRGFASMFKWVVGTMIGTSAVMVAGMSLVATIIK